MPLYKGSKTDAKAAGYMELSGAVKDAECKIVRVIRGVSSDKGCCNLFDPKKNATKFSCGTCNLVQAK